MLIITGVLTACVIVVVLLIVNKPPVYTPAPGAPAIPTKEISGAEAATSTQLLLIDSQVVTAGPSPFDPNVWAVRIQLSATGGDGHYIFWVNGQHLPDASRDQFTAEGKGCAEEHPFVGVTSGGQAASEELVITSPLPGCSTP